MYYFTSSLATCFKIPCKVVHVKGILIKKIKTAKSKYSLIALISYSKNYLFPTTNTYRIEYTNSCYEARRSVLEHRYVVLEKLDSPVYVAQILWAKCWENMMKVVIKFATIIMPNNDQR